MLYFLRLGGGGRGRYFIPPSFVLEILAFQLNMYFLFSQGADVLAKSLEKMGVIHINFYLSFMALTSVG